MSLMWPALHLCRPGSRAWGLTGLQRRSSSRCSSSLLTCGIRTVLFCLNKPLAVLGWFGEGWRGPWMRMSTAVIGKPNGILQFSSPSPPREAGKFCPSLESADPRHPASWATQVQDRWGRWWIFPVCHTCGRKLETSLNSPRPHHWLEIWFSNRHTTSCWVKS